MAKFGKLKVMKHEMIKILRGRMEEMRLSRKEAARLMGLDQSKLTALLKGRIEGFSTDRLFRCLTSLNLNIQIKITESEEVGVITVS